MNAIPPPIPETTGAPEIDQPVATAPQANGQRCGLIAIVGRPNVGKSTLINALVGQKISITSRKAQTTRHRIVGVRTEGTAQFVFVDTPGFQTRHANALNRNLNRTVQGTLGDVDAVLFVVEAGRFGPADERVMALLPPDKPILLLANKLDEIKRRTDLLPWLQKMQQRHPFTEFVPMSATKAPDITRLLGILEPHLPEQAWFYEEGMLTDTASASWPAKSSAKSCFVSPATNCLMRAPWSSTASKKKRSRPSGGYAWRPR